MKHRSMWRGISVAVAGLTLALAPMSVAAARGHRHNPSGTTKGSAPNSAMCKDVRTEQSGSSSVGSSISRAIESGNFATAKQAMLTAYDQDMANVQKALSAIHAAPAKVQAAFKSLLTFVQQVRNDIQNSSSEQGLITSFEGLGRNPQLQTDAVTISTWYTSVCGGTAATTSTTGLG